MDEPEKNRLLRKAGTRSLTSEEREKLDNWYVSFDDTRKDVEVFRDREHEEKVRMRLLDRIIAQIPEHAHEPFIKTFFLKPGNWMKVAAVLAFFIISFPVYNYLKKTNERNIAEASALLTGKAGTGKMVKLVLGDSSEIWLNSGSVIKYPKQFSAEKREVYLEGEAFFQVTHDPKKPFIVHSGKLNTTVLGTSFNIKAYRGIDRIMVNVATGKVGITASGKMLSLLNPNQQISFHTGSGHFEVSEANAKLVTSWQTGKIRLDGASFRELSLVVKNTWGLALETKSSRLEGSNFKTTFNTNDKIEDVMKTIGKMVDAKYRIRDNIITLYE